MKRTLSLVLAVMLVFACFAAFAVNSSAASYVTDGLVANYNASKIANGETTWTDDSGNGNDIVDMLCADRKSDSIWLDTLICKLCFVKLCVCC